MHIAEVDLNYTQYHPLSEVYVSLYPNKTASGEGPKPPMWAEVERCMEDGTLNKLRNRVPAPRVGVSRPVQPKPPKAKVQEQAPPIDTSGLNRRERRKLLVAQRGVKSKNSLSFEASQPRRSKGGDKDNMAMDLQGDGSESDGGFFEE